MDPLGRGQTVEPMLLRCIFHHQQASLFEYDIDGLLRCSVFECKLSLRTKTQRSYGRIFHKVFFSVAMPSHALPPVVVKIEQAGVVLLTALFFRSEERRVGKECRSRWSPYH